MDAPALGPPLAAVPLRLHRRLRLGPFPSGRDALKFLAYAALGVSLAPTTAPLLGVPIVLVGFLFAVYKPGGEALDERTAVLLRYALRRQRGRGHVNPGGSLARGFRGSVLRLGDGRVAAVVRTAGVPLAYLPPAELARRFELFRELLRAIEGDLIVLATASPIFPDPVVPQGPALPSAEGTARRGYRELVGLLARRRAVRRVYLGVVAAGAAADGPGQLEAAVSGLGERLAALGLGTERLRDRALGDAAVRLGLGDGRAGA